MADRYGTIDAAVNAAVDQARCTCETLAAHYTCMQLLCTWLSARDVLAAHPGSAELVRLGMLVGETDPSVHLQFPDSIVASADLAGRVIDAQNTALDRELPAAEAALRRRAGSGHASLTEVADQARRAQSAAQRVQAQIELFLTVLAETPWCAGFLSVTNHRWAGQRVSAAITAASAEEYLRGFSPDTGDHPLRRMYTAALVMSDPDRFGGDRSAYDAALLAGAVLREAGRL